MIAKQLRKRSNQQLAAPLTTTMALSPAEATAVITQVCRSHNEAVAADLARRRTEGHKLKRMAAEGARVTDLQYHVLVLQDGVLIGYQHSPEFILKRNASKIKQAGWGAGWWLATVSFPKPTTPLPAGHYLVEIRLTSWVTNSDGKLRNKDKYEALTNALWQALSSDAN